MNKLFSSMKIMKVLLRSFFWSKIFLNCKTDLKVYGRIVVFYPQKIVVGKRVRLNEGVLLNAREEIIIGDDVHISSGVTINTVGLDYQKTGQQREHCARSVVIEDGVWLGSDAVINPGVTIGKDSVIGAGSVVTKSIPAESVAFGIPAEVKKKIID